MGDALGVRSPSPGGIVCGTSPAELVGGRIAARAETAVRSGSLELSGAGSRSGTASARRGTCSWMPWVTKTMLCSRAKSEHSEVHLLAVRASSAPNGSNSIRISLGIVDGSTRDRRAPLDSAADRCGDRPHIPASPTNRRDRARGPWVALIAARRSPPVTRRCRERSAISTAKCGRKPCRCPPGTHLRDLDGAAVSLHEARPGS